MTQVDSAQETRTFIDSLKRIKLLHTLQSVAGFDVAIITEVGRLGFSQFGQHYCTPEIARVVLFLP